MSTPYTLFVVFLVEVRGGDHGFFVIGKRIAACSVVRNTLHNHVYENKVCYNFR